jgi:alpha-ketoglutarate-dependent taurine dioxygenase
MSIAAAPHPVLHPTLRPLTGTIGVELTGFDLTRPLAADAVAAIRAAVLEHQVAFFPGQNLSLDEQVAFSGQLGTINPAHPVRGTAAGERLEIYRPATFVPGKAAPRWHADHTYMAEPSSFSILRAVRVPDSGGDTQWASLSAAYERLSPALQRLVDGLTAIHTPSLEFIGRIAQFGPGQWNGQPVTHLEPIEHPLVIVHPETGRRSLFINPASITSIVGVPSDHADALLALLLEHAVRPEHVVRYQWTAGSLAVWDNRVTLHYPVADYDNADEREVNRVSLWGERPVGVTGFVSRAVA